MSSISRYNLSGSTTPPYNFLAKTNRAFSLRKMIGTIVLDRTIREFVDSWYDLKVSGLEGQGR